ncbi:TIGR02611 family protein [Streptomyces sp. MTZ3.1]|uniref:TIGR02611 family protein n=1 Tax=Streptomyces meridianus TaxID=2938945 RepID=A0ABT0X3K1_9ACTN|nr:TIGR02611 family protein [Streptomyces meridianus]MCM2577119.1 TIGR02611 family protein [Streptomyces meridianus]
MAPDRHGRDVPDSSHDEAADRPPRPLGSRAPRFVKASRPLHLSWQVGVFAVGLAIVGAGIVLLPLPGPGWLVIFGGMAVWATEFIWAQLILRWTKRKVTEAAHRAMDPKVRRRNTAMLTIGLLVIAAGVGLWVSNFGIRMPWQVG